MTDVDRTVLLRALRALRSGAHNATRAAAGAAPSTAGSASAGSTAAAASAAAASASSWLVNGTSSIRNASYHGNATDEDNGYSSMDNRYWVLVMFLVPLFTIFGNILVVLAVYRERSLQSVTNYFIVSLAFADILVAAIVMPVSVYVEVRNGHWDFSDTLCDLWIMCDALFSTASILNLVAISIDRFIAVTQPIKYAKHKNSKRTHVTIAGSWLLSIGIALPIGCGLQNLQGVRYQEKFRNVCTFFNGDFLIYSSLGSFYIPCIVMLVLYYRIFNVIRARARKAAASRRGKVYENAKASGGSRRNNRKNAAPPGEATAAIALSEQKSKGKKNNSSKKKKEEELQEQQQDGGGPPAVLLVRTNPNRPDQLSVSAVSARDCLACRTDGIYTGEAPIPHSCGLHDDQPVDSNNWKDEEEDYEAEAEDDEEEDEANEEAPQNAESLIPMNESLTLAGPSTSDNSGAGAQAAAPAAAAVAAAAATAAAATSTSATKIVEAGGGRSRQRLFQLKLKKKPKKKKSDRSAARREKKATKTLAIVLGVFLLCWLPFFITNLMWAACLKNMNTGHTLGPICGYDRRINVFIVWLGYVNSFMNPLIYTIFNTEFRKAFKKILRID